MSKPELLFQSEPARFTLGLVLALALCCGLWGVARGPGDEISLKPGPFIEALTRQAQMARARAARTAEAGGDFGFEALAALPPVEATGARSGGPVAAPRDAAAVRQPSTLERRLEVQVARAYAAAADGRGDVAHGLLDAVLTEAPGFRPALTLRGLLDAEWSQGAPDVEDDRPPARRLQPPEELREESTLRIAAHLGSRPFAGSVPSNLLWLSPDIHTVLAADLSRSRLYVLRQGEDGLELQGDYYLSSGSHGSNKQAPGDQRTPIGVYSLQSRLSRAALPPLAGHAAWPLAFPNRWDLWQGRLGWGIWLHGAAPGQVDGLPHSTNGCLAISNGDLDRLEPQLAAAGTVVLVAERLEWLSPQQLEQRRSAALDRLRMVRARRGGAPASSDSIYAYPGENGLLLVRRGEAQRTPVEEFWPAGAVEPLAAAHS